jgi:hypothetical protein
LGDDVELPPLSQNEALLAEARGFRARIVGDAPAVFITLMSVLVGLVFSELFTEARGRMRLWPLDFATVLTWAQLIATGTAALSVWMVTAHLGIVRRRIPQLSEALSCLGPPLLLLTLTSFVGRTDAWPWFYGASAYLVACSLAFVTLVRQAIDQSGGGRFAYLLRPSGCMLILGGGVPVYLACAILDQRGWIGSTMELVLTISTIPASFVVDWMFFRDLMFTVEDPAR